MKKGNKRTFSYRNFHLLIYSQAIVPIIIYTMNRIQGDNIGNSKAAQIIAEAFLVLIFLLVNGHFYKMDIKDEMVKYNLSKANKITLFAVIAVMFVAVLLNDYFIHGLICSDFLWLTVMGAIALRSLLFTIFDAPKKEDMEEEE